MEQEKFSEAIKARALYSARNPGGLELEILKEWDTNQITNAEMTHTAILMREMNSCFKGVFENLLEDHSEMVITLNGGIDARRIIHAIEAVGAQASKIEAEQKKGMLGIGKLGL